MLRDLLKDTFEKHIGIGIKVDVGVVKSKDSFGVANNAIRDIPISELVYTKDKLWKEVVRRDVSYMNAYKNSYEEFFRGL